MGHRPINDVEMTKANGHFPGAYFQMGVTYCINVLHYFWQITGGISDVDRPATLLFQHHSEVLLSCFSNILFIGVCWKNNDFMLDRA